MRHARHLVLNRHIERRPNPRRRLLLSHHLPALKRALSSLPPANPTCPFAPPPQSLRAYLCATTYRLAASTICHAKSHCNPSPFNTAEGWSRDVSEDMADEISKRCARDGFDVPPYLESFIDRYGTGRPTQLPLPPAAQHELSLSNLSG